MPSQGAQEALQAEARSFEAEHVLRLALEAELTAARERVANLERAGMRMTEDLRKSEDLCSDRVWQQYRDDRDSCTCICTSEPAQDLTP